MSAGEMPQRCPIGCGCICCSKSVQSLAPGVTWSRIPATAPIWPLYDTSGNKIGYVVDNGTIPEVQLASPPRQGEDPGEQDAPAAPPVAVTFRPGDIVRLKTRGVHPMMVTSVRDCGSNGQRTICRWYDADGTIQEENFWAGSLVFITATRAAT